MAFTSTCLNKYCARLQQGFQDQTQKITIFLQVSTNNLKNSLTSFLSQIHIGKN